MRLFATFPRSSDSRSGHIGGPIRRCRRSAAPRRLAQEERGVAWIGAVRARGRPAARTASAQIERGRCRRGGAKGLEVSPCRLGEDHLVQRQIRDCASKPGVLRLQVLQLANLVALQPAKFLTPPIIRDFGDADRANRVSNSLSLRNQHVHLSQLRDDLFRLMALSRHLVLLVVQRHTSGWPNSMGVDHSLVCFSRLTVPRGGLRAIASNVPVHVGSLLFGVRTWYTDLAVDGWPILGCLNGALLA